MASRDELSAALMKKDKEIAHLKAQVKTLVGGLVVGETPARAASKGRREPITPHAGTTTDATSSKKIVVLEWDRERHGSPPPPPTPASSSSSSSSSAQGTGVVLAEWDKAKHGSPPPPPTPPRARKELGGEKESLLKNKKSAKKSRKTPGKKKRKTPRKTPGKKTRRTKEKKHTASRKPRTPLLQLSTLNVAATTTTEA